MNDKLNIDTINDPLLSLVVDDAKAVDRERIAQVLKQFVFFGKNGDINFTTLFTQLPNNLEKMEIVFLAEKARSLIFKDGVIEGLSQKDLISMDIMPKGSVKSSLKKLADDKRVRKNTEGKYCLPGYRLTELLDYYGKRKGD